LCGEVGLTDAGVTWGRVAACGVQAYSSCALRAGLRPGG
jgi:hypothetical protein